MGLPAEKDERVSYRDTLAWDDGPRYELIDGEVHAMTPAPARRHQEILFELASRFKSLLEGRPCQVFIAPLDVRLAEPGTPDEDVFDVVQPDIVVVCDPAKLDERGVVGAPDICVEILSPATMKRDLRDKFALYQRHGVREYWILHPADETLSIYALEPDGRLGPPRVLFPGDVAVSRAVPDIAADVGAVFGHPAEPEADPSPDDAAPPA